MEHIYFEAQLCSERAILKEKTQTQWKYCENRLTGGGKTYSYALIYAKGASSMDAFDRRPAAIAQRNFWVREHDFQSTSLS